MSLTNKERAKYAGHAIQTFADETGLDTENEDDMSCAVQDLLSNMMHLCVSKSMDFDDLLRVARNNFTDESVYYVWHGEGCCDNKTNGLAEARRIKAEFLGEGVRGLMRTSPIAT